MLDDFKGLMLGQHVYVEPDEAEDVKTGIWLPSYYILNEGSKNYVWAVNDKNRIEKREVQLGKFDDTLSEYEITSGVTADDRLAVVEDRVHSGMYATDDISYKNQGNDSGDMNDAKTDDANGVMPAENGSDMDGNPNGYSPMPAEGAVTESEGETDTAAGEASTAHGVTTYENDGAASLGTVIGGATA